MVGFGPGGAGAACFPEKADSKIRAGPLGRRREVSEIDAKPRLSEQCRVELSAQELHSVIKTINRAVNFTQNIFLSMNNQFQH